LFKSIFLLQVLFFLLSVKYILDELFLFLENLFQRTLLLLLIL